jgi:hypothetical protein
MNGNSHRNPASATGSSTGTLYNGTDDQTNSTTSVVFPLLHVISVTPLKIKIIYKILIGKEYMSFQFKDLIVTVLPERFGCVLQSATADSATVGSCSSETQCEECGNSDEVFDHEPLSFLNPQVQSDLRQLLVYSLAKSNITTKNPQSIPDLEKKMKPKNIKEIEKLEKELTNALDQLQQHKKELQK